MTPEELAEVRRALTELREEAAAGWSDEYYAGKCAAFDEALALLPEVES